jgi:organic hydroperoxide reductase OsmC/OhrA
MPSNFSENLSMTTRTRFAGFLLGKQLWKFQWNIWATFNLKSKPTSTQFSSDQPVENGGHDEGMTPPELLLASLGSCAGRPV